MIRTYPIPLPEFQAQLDDRVCPKSNCSCNAHGMLATRERLGLRPPGTTAPWPPTGDIIRHAISGTTCGGTDFMDNSVALAGLWKIQPQPRYGLPFADFTAGIRAHRAAVVSGLYSALHGTRFDSCLTFDGGHAVYVNEGRNFGLSTEAYLVGDPLADGRYSTPLGRVVLKGFQWWPKATLAKFAAARAGTGKVDANFGRDTDLPMAYVARLEVVPAHLIARTGPGMQYPESLPVKKAGQRVTTKQLQRFGGTYAGPTRTSRDWVSYTRADGTTAWLPRAWTKTV